MTVQKKKVYFVTSGASLEHGFQITNKIVRKECSFFLLNFQSCVIVLEQNLDGFGYLKFLVKSTQKFVEEGWQQFLCVWGQVSYQFIRLKFISSLALSSGFEV